MIALEDLEMIDVTCPCGLKITTRRAHPETLCFFCQQDIARRASALMPDSFREKERKRKQKARRQRYHAAHREHRLEYMRQYNKDHPRSKRHARQS